MLLHLGRSQHQTAGFVQATKACRSVFILPRLLIEPPAKGGDRVDPNR